MKITIKRPLLCFALLCFVQDALAVLTTTVLIEIEYMND
jgi:hypothetical protein